MLSAAIPAESHDRLVAHLRRKDGQEDLCFALYRLSTGGERTTILLGEIVLPKEGERNVHGNVAFTSSYFLRAADLASEADAGLALLHSHPLGRGWQDLSRDDVAAEQGHAAQTLALTGLPLVGLTMSGHDLAWSARRWIHTDDGARREDCMSVRVVGDALAITHHPRGAVAPTVSARQVRTVSAWGEAVQVDIARLRVGVVGLGSVGSVVAEALGRMGVGHIKLIDFDSVKEHNLDRILHAGADDASTSTSKVQVARRALERSSTHPVPVLDALELSVCESAGWEAALDCDVLFSCVDRPWPRHTLNLAAYAHLIPVIDGGIRARAGQDGRMVAADWRAHVAAPGRRCLQCVGQYEASGVTMEREGLLDDPAYIDSLPDDHPLRARENVFAFGLSAASFEVLQLIAMVAAPLGVFDLGGQMYHAVTGTLSIDGRGCESGCLYSGELLGAGDAAPTLISTHSAAGHERSVRQASQEAQLRVSDTSSSPPAG
ncbi:MAG: ThiF family adenylyltransferase [Solirubrobacteraceae bacterium]